MFRRLRSVRRLIVDLPRHLRLSYCLVVDPRVPALNKAAVVAALLLIVTPFVDVPLWIPVVGEMGGIALSVMTLELFINTAPKAVVREQEELLRQHRSRFDVDLAAGRRLATAISARARHAEADPAPSGGAAAPGAAEPDHRALS